jgi:hypothetical protein
LKVAWISGSTVGGVTPEMQEPTCVVANIVTLLLELAMVGLAVLRLRSGSACAGLADLAATG